MFEPNLTQLELKHNTGVKAERAKREYPRRRRQPYWSKNANFRVPYHL